MGSCISSQPTALDFSPNRPVETIHTHTETKSDHIPQRSSCYPAPPPSSAANDIASPSEPSSLDTASTTTRSSSMHQGTVSHSSPTPASPRTQHNSRPKKHTQDHDDDRPEPMDRKEPTVDVVSTFYETGNRRADARLDRGRSAYERRMQRRDVVTRGFAGLGD